MKRKQTIDTLAVLQAFYQFAHARDDYTNISEEFYVPERDSPWYGSRGTTHNYPATQVYFQPTRTIGMTVHIQRTPHCTGPYIPIIPEKEFQANLVFDRYVGPIEVFEQTGKQITSQKTLDQLANKLLANMKKLEAKH